MAAKPSPRRRADGTTAWVLRFRLTPGASPTSETFDSYAEAEKFGRLVDRVGGAAARQTRNAHTQSGQHTPTLATYITEHLGRLSAHATPGTIADYQSMANRTFLTQLGDLPVDAITEDAVVEWVKWQRQQETHASKARRRSALAAGKTPPPVRTYSTKSIANAQRFLSTALEAAVRRYGLSENPARGTKLPSDDTGTEMVFLTPNEFTTLFGHIPPWYQPLVLTLYGTGMRWGEATALRVNDLDLDADVPTINVSHAWKKGAGNVYDGAPKSRRGRRNIDIGPNLERVLREQVAGKEPTELVFTSQRGGRVRAQNFHPRVWWPAVEASGLGKRPRVHDLRHSHASWLLASGESVLMVQRRLGHESAQTTLEVYTHYIPTPGQVGLTSSDAVLGQAVPQIEA